MLTYKLLKPYKEIAHFCTTREGGVSVGNYASRNLSPFSGDRSEHFDENKSDLCKALSITTDHLIIPRQTHSSDVRNITPEYFRLPDEEKASYLDGIDAIFTKMYGVCLGITTADCVPLLFFDPVQKVVGAAHAGWRGTCGHIGAKTVRAMVETYQCRPNDILVTIGPSISAAVYEVGKEVKEQFTQAGFDTDSIFKTRNGSIFLDLWAANQQSLEKAGILPNHIETAGICTFSEHERYFSARRLGINSGRMLSGIMIKG